MLLKGGVATPSTPPLDPPLTWAQKGKLVTRDLKIEDGVIC